jgi:hypothetical protein
MGADARSLEGHIGFRVSRMEVLSDETRPINGHYNRLPHSYLHEATMV